MGITEFVIAGLITYVIAICFKYLFKIIWAFINWLAEKYISEVLNAEIEGDPMVDYYPIKEISRIRKAVKNVR